jgi:hypothetical protein
MGLSQEIAELVNERTASDARLKAALTREEGLELTPMTAAVTALGLVRLVYEIELRIAEHIDALGDAE